jgi:two-component system, cell cycle sensor histidine kinase and response regulator CckA
MELHLRAMTTDQDRIIRQMVDDLREIVFRTDAQGRWTFLNPTWQEITGFRVSESLGTACLDYVHPDDRNANLERFRQLAEKRKDYCRQEMRYITKGGDICWVEVHARALLDVAGEFCGVCGTISNINDRHAATEALKQREGVLEAIGSVAQTFLQGKDWEAAIPFATECLGPAANADGIVVLWRIVDERGQMMVVPRHIWRRPGVQLLTVGQPIPAIASWERVLERGEVLVRQVSALPPDEAAGLAERGIRHIAIVPILAGDVLWGNMTFLRRSDVAWSPATIEGLRVAAGIVGAAIRQSASQEKLRLAHDELEKHVAERTAELKRSEHRFQAIFDQAPIGMALVDSQGRIHYTNSSFRGMLERTGEELDGMNVLDITHPDDRQTSTELIHTASSLSKEVRQLEKRYLAKSGREIFARTTVTNLHIDEASGNFNLAMVEDVTDRKILEEQFLHAQKMEAVGRLTSGITHDFNNILTVIKGYGELLMKALHNDPRSLRKATQIVKAVERASSMVNQLLAFSRKKAVEPKAMDVNATLAEMRGLLRHLLREDIALVMPLEQKAGTVKMDPGQFGQMVMNLVANARDAISGSGSVTIATRIVVVGPEARLDDARLKWAVGMGNYSLLEVKDTGCGMSPEVRSRIFEPFFTTKEQGKGTGLGLSTVYGIVKQSGGAITVESAPGAGSTFRIYLPLTLEGTPETDLSLARLAHAVGGETILVAEDEDDVRTVMADVLRDGGYQVVEARDGMEALKAADDYRGTIDLLLTDVVMPKMGGPELWDHLWERFPDMRFLFTSGHSEESSEHDPTVLHKPFSTAELTARVREILDAPRSGPFHPAAHRLPA